MMDVALPMRPRQYRLNTKEPFAKRWDCTEQPSGLEGRNGVYIPTNSENC